jgi:hypothetical protein
MKRIETRDNDFLVQFRKSLQSSFPHVLNITVDYYLGEDKKGKRGLYLTVTSKFGLLYRKVMNLTGGQTVYDVEGEFMNVVIDDLIMNGITFFNLLAFDSVDPRRVEKEIKATPFKHNAPRKFIYQN